MCDVTLCLGERVVARVAVVDDDLTVADLIEALPISVPTDAIRFYLDSKHSRQVLRVQRPLRIWQHVQATAAEKSETLQLFLGN